MGNMDFGNIKISLDNIIKKKKISKNLLAEKANLQRTQLNAYCNNKIKRPDFEVLSRICYALECDIADILKYTKPNKGEEWNGDNWSL